MTVVEGSYLLWFAHFGSLQCHQMDSIEDAIDLVVRLRNVDMCEYDEYGSADFLECVGHGVVDDFFARCDAAEEQRQREWRELQAHQARERASNPEGPRYSIVLSPPKDQSPFLRRPGQELMSGLDGEVVIVERDRLEALFGPDRITVYPAPPVAAS